MKKEQDNLSTDQKAEKIFHLVSEIGLGEYITEQGVGIHILQDGDSYLTNEVTFRVYTSDGLCFKALETSQDDGDTIYEVDDYFPGFKEINIDEIIEILTNLKDNQLPQTWKTY